jgi:hypothetical protein
MWEDQELALFLHKLGVPSRYIDMARLHCLTYTFPTDGIYGLMVGKVLDIRAPMERRTFEPRS